MPRFLMKKASIKILTFSFMELIIFFFCWFLTKNYIFFHNLIVFVSIYINTMLVPNLYISKYMLLKLYYFTFKSFPERNFFVEIQSFVKKSFTNTLFRPDRECFAIMVNLIKDDSSVQFFSKSSVVLILIA